MRTCIWLFLFCVPFSAFDAGKVTLQLIWKNQFQYAGYYVAKKLGFYGEAERDVTIKEYEYGNGVTADVVAWKTGSCTPLSKQIIQMGEDFDLDGIQKLADALDAC